MVSLSRTQISPVGIKSAAQPVTLFFLNYLPTVCVSVEASVHGTSVHCSDKTFEAAEALLRMDSPSSLREDRSPGNTH